MASSDAASYPRQMRSDRSMCSAESPTESFNGLIKPTATEDMALQIETGLKLLIVLPGILRDHSTLPTTRRREGTAAGTTSPVSRSACGHTSATPGESSDHLLAQTTPSPSSPALLEPAISTAASRRTSRPRTPMAYGGRSLHPSRQPPRSMGSFVSSFETSQSVDAIMGHPTQFGSTCATARHCSALQAQQVHPSNNGSGHGDTTWRRHGSILTSTSGDGSRSMPSPQTQTRSAGERVTAYVPSISEDELLSWLQAGNVPTTDQEKNDKFFIFTCATLEASETLPLAELECTKGNIVVEASADLSLKSDCEAFRDEYQRIYEMDEYAVQALRKYIRRYNRDSLKLINWLIPRLSQFYEPLADSLAARNVYTSRNWHRLHSTKDTDSNAMAWDNETSEPELDENNAEPADDAVDQIDETPCSMPTIYGTDNALAAALDDAKAKHGAELDAAKATHEAGLDDAKAKHAVEIDDARFWASQAARMAKSQ
ncbi:hypothetical protein THAOC_14447, partial [Thalassiosira oceanica]